MRVVLDTNVLISALVWPHGVPSQVVGLARQGRIRSVVSPVLLDEFRRVLQEKFEFQSDFTEVAVEMILGHSDVIVPRRALRVIRADPDDDRVLECAVEGRAGTIVTGDRHLLVLKDFQGIRILTPREFLTLVRV